MYTDTLCTSYMCLQDSYEVCKIKRKFVTFKATEEDYSLQQTKEDLYENILCRHWLEGALCLCCCSPF
jgi:hypothetical protein